MSEQTTNTPLKPQICWALDSMISTSLIDAIYSDDPEMKEHYLEILPEVVADLRKFQLDENSYLTENLPRVERWIASKGETRW
jgi:hypothetical protein